MKRRLLLSLLFLASFVSTPARAFCLWWTAPSTLDFLDYSAFSTQDLPGDTDLVILCSRGENVTIRLSRGSSTTFFPRTMGDGSEDLEYNLYLDSAGTQVWGDQTGGTVYRFTTPSLGFFGATIYGRVPFGQDADVGSFTDTITATLISSSGTSTRTFDVRAEVIPECKATGASLAFGDYEPIVQNATTPRDRESQVGVLCTKGTTANVGVNYGRYSLVPGDIRRMQKSGPVDYLEYDVFRDSARQTRWLPGAFATMTSTSKDTPLEGGIWLWGRIFQGQDVSVGSYSDTLQLTVNY
jgi:spore coat protein U-like protein